MQLMQKVFVTAALLGICHAQAQEAVDPTAVVTLEAVAGLTISIPEGWASCDDALHRRLKGTEYRRVVVNQICAAADPILTFIVSGGVVPPVTVMAGQGPAMAMTEEIWNGIDDTQLEAIRTQTEQMMNVMLAGKGKLDGHMTMRKDRIDGYPAFVSTFTIVPTIGEIGKAYTERWEIMAEGTTMIIAFSYPSLMEAAGRPVVEQIRATLMLGRRL